METESSPHYYYLNRVLLILSILLLQELGGECSTCRNFGAIYGREGSNLPPPDKVASFLKGTNIDNVMISDAAHEVIKAFANTGISLSIGIPNSQYPSLADAAAADQWVSTNVKPFVPATTIKYITVGSEVAKLVEGEENRVKLVAAMTNIHQALRQAGINDIRVSTAHSFGSIITTFQPPSSARLKPQLDAVLLLPMLKFLRETQSPLMMNMVYFKDEALKDEKGLLLCKIGSSIHDPATNITYKHALGILLDSTFTALKSAGYGDLDIVVSAIGWPTKCDPGKLPCSVEVARDHNIQILKKVRVGTPLMPNQIFETFFYSLFNEDSKPTVAGRNFGIFNPDFTPVFNFGARKL